MPIRPYQPPDRAEWLRLRRQLWPEWPDDMQEMEMRETLAQPASRQVFIYERDNGKLGGFIELHVRHRVNGAASPQVAYIEGWHVDPDLQRQGIGRQLVLAGEQWAAAHGLTEIASDTEITNTASIQAHLKLGFEESYRLVHFLKELPDETGLPS